MKLQKIIFILMCSICVNFVMSQNTTDPFDQNIIMQTPNKSEFAEIMGQFTVNHFTGQPNVEIPIHTIVNYDISVPIALKYRSGGIKVDVEDSYTGKFWDLIVGGEIRRTVVGIPDDINTNETKGYRRINESISGYTSHNRREFVDLILNKETPFVPHYLDCNEVKQSSIYGQQYSDGRFDTSPDIFNFNVNGISGTFTTGRTSFYDNLQSNEWISLSMESNGDYKIKDANGYTYIFGEKEYHTHKYRTGYFGDFIAWNQKAVQKADYVLTWKLSEIISPTGERVKFIYETHKNIDPQLEASFCSTQSSYSINYFHKMCHEHTTKWHPSVITPCFSEFSHQNKENYTYKYLKRIEAKNCIVEFIYRQINETSIPKLIRIDIIAGIEKPTLLKKFCNK